MKVELLLADDTELRKAVKDLIKAEVLSIARSEILSIIGDVVGDKIVAEYKVNSLIKEAVREGLKSYLGGTDYAITERMRGLVKEELRPILKKALDDTKLGDLV